MVSDLVDCTWWLPQKGKRRSLEWFSSLHLASWAMPSQQYAMPEEQAPRPEQDQRASE